MSSCKRTRVETDHLTNGDEAKSSAMERALKVQRNLSSEIPSFEGYRLFLAGWYDTPKKVDE